MGINREEYGAEDLDSLSGRVSGNPFSSKSKRGGQKGHKSSGSKSVLEGGPKHGRDHLCWGTGCDADATRLAGIPTTDPEAAKIEKFSFVPLCHSCAGKVKRRADKRGLPQPNITPMTRAVSEAYKGQVNSPSAKPNEHVEKFIASQRAGSDNIFELGDQKFQKQYKSGQYRKNTKAGNPNLGGHPLFKAIANERRKEERDRLTVRAQRGEFESLKEPKRRGKKEK